MTIMRRTPKTSGIPLIPIAKKGGRHAASQRRGGGETQLLRLFVAICFTRRRFEVARKIGSDRSITGQRVEIVRSTLLTRSGRRCFKR
jgi:hypothetical protein